MKRTFSVTLERAMLEVGVLEASEGMTIFPKLVRPAMHGMVSG